MTKIYSVRGQLNLYVDKINLIVGISKFFFFKSSLMSPNKRVYVIDESLCFEMLSLI